MTENLLWTKAVLSGILMAGHSGSVKRSGLVESRAEIHLFPWLLGKGVVLAKLSRDTWEQRTSLEGLHQFGWNPGAVTCIYLGGGRTCLCHIPGVLTPWDSVSCSSPRWLTGHWWEPGQALSSSSSWRCCGGKNQPMESSKKESAGVAWEKNVLCAHRVGSSHQEKEFWGCLVLLIILRGIMFLDNSIYCSHFRQALEKMSLQTLAALPSVNF